MTQERIARLQKKLTENDLDAYLVEDPVELFYLTGLQLSLGALVVTREKALLIVDGRYYQECSEKSFIPLGKLEEKPMLDFLEAEGVELLGIDQAKTSLEAFRNLETKLKGIDLSSLPSLVSSLRLIKDQEEIALLERSAKANWEIFLKLQEHFVEGMSEKEALGILSHLIFCENKKSFAFDAIIAFGENSAKPHHHCSDRRLKKGDLILVDMGVVCDHYHSDMTRCIFFGGVPEKLKELYEITVQAQRAALRECRAGATYGQLDLAAREVMKIHGVEDLFCHSLGHGIGLETHELPGLSSKSEKKDSLLEEGMVITIEPGLYIPKLGGIRYEDTVVVTKEGYRNFYPEEFSPSTS